MGQKHPKEIKQIDASVTETNISSNNPKISQSVEKPKRCSKITCILVSVIIGVIIVIAITVIIILFKNKEINPPCCLPPPGSRIENTSHPMMDATIIDTIISSEQTSETTSASSPDRPLNSEIVISTNQEDLKSIKVVQKSYDKSDFNDKLF